MPLFGRSTPRDEAKAHACGDWLSRRHPLAIASLVVGVFSLTHLGTLVVDSVAGIVLGALALKALSAPAPGASMHGHRLAWAGILTSTLSLAIAVVLYTWPISR